MRDGMQKAWSRIKRAALERDASVDTIRKLEQEIADERQRSAGLEETIGELRFQLEVQEKGYAKQLTEARERREAAERAMAEQTQRTAVLETAHAETLQALARVRTELELYTDATSSARVPDDVPTLDELMQEPTDPARDQCVDAAADTADLLSPDLVFTGEDDDEDRPEAG